MSCNKNVEQFEIKCTAILQRTEYREKYNGVDTLYHYKSGVCWCKKRKFYGFVLQQAEKESLKSDTENY